MKIAGFSNSTSDKITPNVEQLQQCISMMSEEIRVLKEQLFLATRKRFAASSEAFSVDQLFLFSTADTTVVIVQPETKPTTDDKPKKRKLRQAVTVHKDTPVERIELDLEPIEKVCACCAGALHKIGEDCTRQVEFIPSQARVIETIRPKYACRHCETGIQQKPLPPSPIPKSMATASLLAFIIVSKYLDHLPLNRIERILARGGITLPRSTQSDWVIRAAQLLAPLTALMRRELLTAPQIFTDDTILPLQNSCKKRNKLVQARLWVYATQPKTGPPIIIYDFTRTRSQQGPQQFLSDYRGYLQADAYAGYNVLYRKGAKEVACWAHCRRKFFEASELEREPGRAHEALLLIRQLYRVEREIKLFHHKKRKKLRRLRAKPLLNKIRRWLVTQAASCLPKSKLGIAVTYALNQWNGLIRYCEAGYLSIDNNYAEGEMRPVALGRKNYLFTGSERGGQAAATLYSLVESAKVNQLNVYEYLCDVLQRLPGTDGESLQHLLPHYWQPEGKLS